MKTVALIDLWWVGHHPIYYRLFCQAILAAGYRVVAFCPQPEEVKSWDPAACTDRRLETFALKDELGRKSWRRKIAPLASRHRFRLCAQRLADWEAENNHRIDLVFFACFYHGVAPGGRLEAIFPYRWTGLMLDSGCVRLYNDPRAWLKYRSFDRLGIFRARDCVSLATFDGFIREQLSRRTGGKPVYVLPEVASNHIPRPDFALAQKFRVAAAGRRVIGCFGQFARRKGALGFLRLAESCRDEPWFFAWAGELEERTFSRSEWRWVQAFLATSPTNCQVEFGRIGDEADFDALIALSDVLYLCYHRHVGSSGLISRAVAHGKSILVSEGYCMADRTRRYDLGLCVPEDDLPRARAALHRLLSSDGDLPPPRFDVYREAHSPAKFAEVVTDMVRDAL